MSQRKQRTRFMLGLFALGLLAGAILTCNPAQAASGVGPLLPEPAWDRKLACPTTANCPRFLVLTNWNSEAVLDKETGLVWERSPDPTLAIWSAARSACTLKAIGNRKGWRLPSMPELASLMDPSVTSGLTLPPGHPFVNILQSHVYWSSTTNADDPTQAWDLFFGNGIASVNSFQKTSSELVWCVRGAMNAGQY